MVTGQGRPIPDVTRKERLEAAQGIGIAAEWRKEIRRDGLRITLKPLHKYQWIFRLEDFLDRTLQQKIKVVIGKGRRHGNSG